MLPGVSIAGSVIMSFDNSSPKVTSGPTRAGRLRRFYVFAVSALAAFAIALALQRDMTADYIATATLTAAPGAARQADSNLRSMKQALVAGDTIRAAASDAGLALATSDADSEPRDSALSVEEIRQRLKLHAGQNRDGGAAIAVAWTGPSERATVGLLNALSRQAVQQLARHNEDTIADQQAIAAAERGSIAATQDVADAKRKRDVFVAENERLLSMPVAADGPSLPTTDESPARSAAANEQARQRVSEVDRRLEEMQRVRRQLLTSMTPDHPHFQLVRDQISQLQAEIEEANRSLAPAKPPVREVANDVAAQRQQQRQQQLMQHLAMLESSVATAKTRQEDATRKLADLRRAAASRLPQETWRIEPAQTAQCIPRRTSPAAFLLSLTLGLAAGSATLLLGGATRLIQRAAEIPQLLHVPLLASLADAGEPVPGRARAAHRPSRWILLASEATLALFLGAMLIVALTNHDFATQVANDPLAALAEGVRRLPATFGGPIL